MRRLAESEAGFGLIELLIAMTVMVIAIMAIVAGFSSGMVALNRASRASTAATFADIQMEAYRKVRYTDAALNRPAARARQPPPTASWASKPGPDGRSYRVDAAVRFDCAVGTLGGTVPSSATCTGGGSRATHEACQARRLRPVDDTRQRAVRETSTFDQATG